MALLPSNSTLLPSSTSTPAQAPASTSAPTSASTPRRIRYALVGLGNIAQVAVLPGFTQARNSELAALVSGDRKKLTALKKKHGGPKTYLYDKFEECLADPSIDAVYIALPNDLHVDCALRAAEAGKHILCEKPLATRAADARLMQRVAAQRGVKLMTAYRLHFEPGTLATIELVRSGQLGETRYFTSSFSYQVTDEDNIRLQIDRGGGPIYDIGTYCINAARYLMEDEPMEVSAMLARTGDKRFDEVEETAAVTLRFPRGRLASFIVSFGAAAVSRLELVGTKGRVVLEPAYEYSEALKQVITIGENEPKKKTFPHTDQFGGEIEAFSTCILENKEPEPSAEEGVADLRVIDAIFASAQSGRSIRLKPFGRSKRPKKEQTKEKPAVQEPKPVRADSPSD